MEDHRKENDELKRLGRVKVLNDVDRRARELRRSGKQIGMWTQAEKDRAAILTLYSLLMDELSDAQTELKTLRRPAGLNRIAESVLYPFDGPERTW